MTFARNLTEYRERRAAEKEANARALAIPSRALTKGTMVQVGDQPVPCPKDVKARPGKRAPTVEERTWLDAIVAYGCVACRHDGHGVVPPAVHHIVRGNVRLGHLFTLPLCDPGHHQGGQQRGMVSRHPWKSQFEQKYGSEFDLLAGLQVELGFKTEEGTT